MATSTTGLRAVARIVLAGTAAAEWLADQGTRLAEPQEDLRLYADQLVVGDLTISRMYHNARQVIRERRSDGLRLSVVADGEISVADASGRFDLARGAAYVHAGTDAVTVETDAPCGTVEVELAADFAARLGVAAPRTLLLAAPDLGTTRILLATVVATLNSGPTATEASWRHVHDVIENAAAAVLSETVPTSPIHPSVAIDRLLQRAKEVIDARHRDEEFGVTDLASLLSVSPAHLHKAFARAGTTPLTEIHRTRVRTAQRIVERRTSPSKADREIIARLAGFRSLRALRAAERLLARRS